MVKKMQIRPTMDSISEVESLASRTHLSPWSWPPSSSPWPQTLQVLESVLSLARGQHCFLIGGKENNSG